MGATELIFLRHRMCAEYYEAERDETEMLKMKRPKSQQIKMLALKTLPAALHGEQEEQIERAGH